MRKIWTIAWKDLYTTFSDRNLVMIMLAAPLAIATIIGLAFGNLASGDIPVSDIPVAVVNLDTGSTNINYGSIFVSALVPPADGENATSALPSCEATAGSAAPTAGTTNVLFDLTETVVLDDPAVARDGVDDGTYTAAIIIPADFSQKINYGFSDPVEATQVEVYANTGRAVGAGIIRSVVQSIGNQIATGNIAVAATLDTIMTQYGVARLGQVASDPAFAASLGCAFTPRFNSLTIDQQTVAGQSSSGIAAILVLFGSAQAMFFMLFTGQQGVLSIFEERQQWTLQRLVVTPTPRLYILLGKIVGTFVSCVVQLVFLFIALTIVGSIMSGQAVFIWGNNLLLLGLVICAAAAASTGIGTFLAGVARTPDQGAMFAQILNLAMALLGGAFGFVPSEALSRFSLIYWGTNAFQKLAAGQNDIGLNLVILFGFFILLFGVGFWLFNRRLDI
ncbi:MAG: ABC transporter permease [Anaerolineae bacterium]|nr:ABC transporter permease [Anaerolineae bacterium]